MVLDYCAIGKRIKAARIKAELTQERLAEHAHLSTSYIGKIETGTTKLSLQTLVNIADVLHTSADALLSDHVSYPDVYMKKNFEDLLKDMTAEELRIAENTLSALRASLIQCRRPESGNA